MSVRNDDSLTTREAPDRLHYAEGMLLGAEDFLLEQTYHRGRLARALAYLHGGGTAAGLRVTVEPANNEIRVSPGVAVDRLGRLIELPRTACLDLPRWWQAASPGALIGAFQGGAVTADVFARFVACGHGKTPAFATGPFDALDAVQDALVRDAWQLELLPRDDVADPSTERLPPAGWPDVPAGSSFETWSGDLRDHLLEQGWQHDTRTWTESGGQMIPPPQPEHRAGQDTTALFLARVRLPATRVGAAPPTLNLAALAGVTPDNRPRRFLYPTSALAHFLRRVVAP